tara:strand:+ start:1852 stop:2538 length:687 start_codon:yes stop_codon:yes gene_type:complete
MKNKQELEETLTSMKGTNLNTAEQRSADDGYFGRSLEESLGVKENNYKNGDLELDDGTRVELKTTNGKCRTTLFSKEPIWGCNSMFTKMKQFFDNYSYEADDSRQKLNMTISANYRNNRGFKLIVEGEYLIINHETDGNCAKWKLESLLKSASIKLDNLVVVKRSDNGEIIDSTFSNGFDKDLFKKMILDGQIIAETRLSMKASGLKNRGTCFRIHPKRINEMYTEEK